MGVLSQILVIVGVFALLVVVLVVFQRGLDKPGGREGLGAIGDAFGPLSEIFHPAQHRATQELKRKQNQGAVTPSPDDDDDDPLTLLKHPDGRPRAIRIRPGRRDLSDGE